MITKRLEKKLARLMLRQLAAKDRGKAAYAEADELLDEIAKIVPLATPVKLDDSGRTGTLVDQFAEKAIVWKPCGVRRFDLKVQQAKIA